MARPDATRLTRRVQVNVASAPSPEAGVYAPLDVRVPVDSGTLTLQHLAQALGVGAEVAAQAKPQRDAKLREQGKADALTGHVDKRKEESRYYSAYEEGVHEATVLREYNDAERRVVERAAQELDRSLPWDQQAAQVDAWMREELGDLVSDDPRARTLIADRYSNFIQTTANKILESVTTQQVKDSTDATLADTLDDIRKGGDGRFAEGVARIAKLTGDENSAAQTLVGAYLQAASEVATDGDLETAEKEVKRILGLIPEQVQLPGGTVVRPRSLPALANTIGDTQQQALETVKRRVHENAQEHFLEFAKRHADATLEGELLPWSYYKDAADRKIVSQQYAVSAYEENRRAFESRRAKWDADAFLDRVLADPTKDWRYYNGFTLPDGSVAKNEDFQRRFDAMMQGLIAREGEAGWEKVLAHSRRTGLAYTPLRTAMSHLGGEHVTAVATHYARYKQLRAFGMADMYVDEKAMPYYQLAEAMEAAGTPILNPDGSQNPRGVQALKDRLSKFEPDRAKQWVAEGRSAIQKKLGAQAVNTDGFDTYVSSLTNAGYAKSLILRMAEPSLQLGLDADTALKSAVERVQRTHFVLETNDQEFLLPRSPGVDAQRLQEAVDHFSETTLLEYARRAGLSADDVRLVPEMLGGRDIEFRVMDNLGNNLAGGKFWSPQELIRGYTQIKGEQANAKARAVQRVNRAISREMRRRKESGEYWTDVLRGPKF